MRRRTFLQVGAASGVSLVLSSGTLGTAYAATRRRAYVLVVDGCRPGEITTALTPSLAALRSDGTDFPRARSLPVMETIPNHVMMMTGVRPDRSGVPANTVYDRAAQAVRDLDRPGDLRFPTLLERMGRHGLTSGTVLSKEYLYGIFGTRATHRWEPAPVVPVSGHAPDQFTMDAAIAMVRELDPHLVFVNLGDCDRVGHSDLSGTSLQVARTAALVSVDQQVERFVSMLQDTGRWEDALVVVLADHSMDWSLPHRVVSLAPALAADPLLAGNVRIADNGGADLLSWTGPAGDRDDAVARMRELVAGVEGVLSSHEPGALRLGPEAGDLVVYCRAGWRFSDPEVYANPIPGNHGHPATRPIPFFVSGGHRVVRRGASSTAVARTVDVAPTVGAFFGLGEPPGGYDGRPRLG
jgi:ectonucleotide pyrophosphatase/phosphodiesterase family protein 5